MPFVVLHTHRRHIVADTKLTIKSMKRVPKDSLRLAQAREPHDSIKNVTHNAVLKEADVVQDTLHSKIAILRPDKDSLSIPMKFLFSIPQFSVSAVLIFVHVYVLTFYESLGVDFSALVVFLAISRGLDIIIDPLISYKSRLLCAEDEEISHVSGRYRMYLCTISTIIFFIIFVLLMSPSESLEDSKLNFYYGIVYLLFVIVHSCLSVPYHTIQSEYASGRVRNDRTYLYFLNGFFETAGLFFLFLISGFVSNNSLVSSVDSLSGCSGNAQGIAHSCGQNSATQYTVFNATLWSLNITTPGLNTTCRSFEGNLLTSPSQLLTAEHCQQYFDSNDCISQYCHCISECSTEQDVANSRDGFMSLGVIYGMIALISMFALLIKLYGPTELFRNPFSHRISAAADHTTLSTTVTVTRQQFVPTILCIWNNHLFRGFLAPWILDIFLYMILCCTMHLFVNVVMQPEFTTSDDNGGYNCNAGVAVVGTDSHKWQCKSNAVTGVILAIIALVSCLSSPFWLYLSTFVGKMRTWQVGSGLSALCILIFVFAVGKGQVATAVSLSALIGLGFGSRFLSEVILGDVIDHDEFMSGQRNDSIFVILKPFLIKLSAFIAVVLPYSVLFSLGYKHGMNHEAIVQNKSIQNFCIMLTVGIPCVLSGISYLLKLQLRFREDIQSEITSYGIKMHRIGRPAIEAVSGVEYPVAAYTIVELDQVYLFNHFPSIDAAVDLKACIAANAPQIEVKILTNRMRDWLGVLFISTVGGIVGIILTGSNIKFGDSTFIIPLLLIIFTAYAMVLSYFFIKRLYAALKLKDLSALPSDQLLQKIIRNRGDCVAMKSKRERHNKTVKEIVREYKHKKHIYMHYLLTQQQRTEGESGKNKEGSGSDSDNSDDSAIDEQGEEYQALEREEKLLELNLKTLQDKQTRFETAITATKLEKIRRPLSQWDVEMYSFILEQEMDNKEGLGGAALLEEQEEDKDDSSTDLSTQEDEDEEKDDSDNSDDSTGGAASAARAKAKAKSAAHKASTASSTADKKAGKRSARGGEDEDDKQAAYDEQKHHTSSATAAKNSLSAANHHNHHQANQNSDKHSDPESDEDDDEDDVSDLATGRDVAVRIDFKRLTMMPGGPSSGKMGITPSAGSSGLTRRAPPAVNRAPRQSMRQPMGGGSSSTGAGHRSTPAAAAAHSSPLSTSSAGKFSEKSDSSSDEDD